jgi:hypothetical protein
MQVTAAVAAVAAASAYIGLFKRLPIDRAYQYAAEVTPVPSLPPYPGPNFRLPSNYGGGTLIDMLA